MDSGINGLISVGETMRGFHPEYVLEEKALALVSKYKMLEVGDIVVVSVSGGADSLALLLFLNKISDLFNLQIRIFHLDHMIRGDESARDAEFVKEIACDLGIPAEIERADVKSFVKKSGLSTQDAARLVRMERLEAFALRAGAERIALGHSADDQVETFLMRIIQGAGLSGLSGIPPVRGKIIRPLLNVWRSEIEEYVNAFGLSFRIDSSNLAPVYLRNKVRLKLLPLLEKEFGRSVKESILRIVESLSVDFDYISAQTQKSFEQIAVLQEKRVSMDVESLIKLHESLRRGVLREAWCWLVPGKQTLGWRHTLDIEEKVLYGRTHAALNLPGNVVVERTRNEVVFRLAENESFADESIYQSASPVTLAIPGKAFNPWSGDLIEARLVERKKCDFSGDPLVEYVNAGKVKGPLTVRTLRAGDRFQPLGMKGLKKVSDFFTDLKVPLEDRLKCSIVLSQGEIVWVAGYRIDERFKVEKGDKEVLMLKLVKGASNLIEG